MFKTSIGLYLKSFSIFTKRRSHNKVSKEITNRKNRNQINVYGRKRKKKFRLESELCHPSARPFTSG